MRPSTRLGVPLLCGLVGFGLGSLSWSLTTVLHAQIEPGTPPPAASEGKTVDISTANAEKIKQAHDAIAIAEQAMIQDGRYTPAIRTQNSYVVLAGGVDAIADLEAGRGVDPVTFAGLYAGEAVDEVLPHLDKDTLGRLTYKGKLVRMYPVERMRELSDTQAAILDVSAGGSGTIGALPGQ